MTNDRGAGAAARCPADRGNATVLTAIGGAAMLALLIIALQVGSAVIIRHRAEAAADLAALAGAAQLLFGQDSACGQAGSIAAANGGRLDACELLGQDLRVVVSVQARVGPIGSSAQGRARAGPIQFAAPP